MKKKLCKLLLSVSLLTSSLMAMDEKDYSFETRVKQFTGIDVSPAEVASNVQGYKVPLFTSEPNRNHFDERPQGESTPIEFLVMHYTVFDLSETLSVFTKDVPQGRVSAHYVISEKEFNFPGGHIIQLVDNKKRAWHAGVSEWREVKNLNASSIGIENVNKGFTDDTSGRTWYPFDTDQIHALGTLSQALVKEYNIRPNYVIGHSDIATGRKSDPGVLFPWGELYYKYKVGAWLEKKEQIDRSVIEQYIPKEPLPQGISDSFMMSYLNEYGYRGEYEPMLEAFRIHFSCNQHPEELKKPLSSKDMHWIWALTAKYK